MGANDRAAMREALGKVNEIYDILSKPCIVIEDARQACREARAVLIPALDKPPLQCDVGTAEEQNKRFVEYCKNHRIKITGHADACNPKCPCRKGGDLNLCTLAWAQTPYVEEDIDTDTTGKGEAEKVNADGTEVTTPKHLIILIENCIKDIVSMTHGEFRPMKSAFNIAVTMSYVRLLEKPIGEGEEAKVTANVYQTMKWKYPRADIVGVEDRDHYIVRVDAVVNGKPYSSYRKTLGEGAVRA